MEPIQSQLHSQVTQRNNRLAEVAAELKTELFGIDDVIDRVIESLRAWYVLPKLINRPVIICLWGLTGTGKTQLTRSIAKKLAFYDRFVEVQMDGFSNGSGYRASSISGMLSNSGIEEGEPGILVLDEFQRFRTVSAKGEDIKVERYQDVWTLLSDGRLAPALSFMSTLEYSLADSEYDHERATRSDKEKGEAPYRFRLTPYEARALKQCLKLKEQLTDIMGWTPDEIQSRLHAFRQQAGAWETDYSKLLIFVSGNLDEMYEHTAKRVQDCDTDADIFHELTKKLSIIDVKNALGQRFKPEQIARLGNDHVIYPSFSRATYEKLIEVTCGRYLDDLERSSTLRFEIGPDVRSEIYANAVFPAQGTRPLFSSIHTILSAPLVSAALWAIENGATALDPIGVRLDADKKHLVVHFREWASIYPVTFELNHLKQRANRDFRALLAVHESGHGMLYGILFQQVPQELKINAASFDGGYTSYAELRAETRQNCLDRICIGLGGRAAEAMVFGVDACTTGAEKDFKQATARAARFVRHFGFGQRFSRTDVARDSDENINTAVDPTNTEIETLLSEQYARAAQLLQENRSVFMSVARGLLDHGEVSRQQFAEWLGLPIPATGSGVMEPYANRLTAFEAQLKVIDRLVELTGTVDGELVGTDSSANLLTRWG